MKRRGLRLPDYVCRMWEQSGDVYVYAHKDAQLKHVEGIVSTIKNLIAEFKLPLRAVNGNVTRSQDVSLVDNLVVNNTLDGLIDCKNMLEDVRRDWNERVFRYGLVVLVNPQRYEFKNESSDPEPAIYGWIDTEGLSVLRKWDQNAVRHEFGHMVGLATIEHHPNCAMTYDCSVYEFCENCIRDINEIWELADNSACGAGDSIKPGA